MTTARAGGSAVRFAERTRQMRSSEIRELLKRTGPDTVALAGGLPSPAMFPVEETKAATQRVLSEHGARALQYGPTEGDAALRAEVAARLPGAEPDDVLVTSGSQQGLDLVARILLDPGDAVAVAAPTYMGALRAFDACQARYLSVPGDAGGMDPDALEAVLAQRPKFVYVIPDFDNPAGSRMDLGRRRALLDAAERHDVPVLEDAPYRELRFEGEAEPTLFELAPDRVLHLGTLSKTMAPGLRVAWLVAPPEVRAMAVKAKQAADLHTGSLVQLLAGELLRSGLLEARLEPLRAHYRRQRDALHEALREVLADEADWDLPTGGMFLWLRLRRELDAAAILPEAVRRGVSFVPGGPFFTDGGGERMLRLSYSLHPPEELAEGARRLAAAVREAPVPATNR